MILNAANGRYDRQVKDIIAANGCASGGGECTQNYTVVSGDTCSVIETKTGISDTQLHALNPMINSGCTSMLPIHLLCQYVLSFFLPDLSIDQTLCLGVCAETYTVVSGDTCNAIETRTSISDTRLHALNPMINSGCTNLSVGQTLCLGLCAQTYTVVSGDTCNTIEIRTGISDAQLHALNPIINSGCTSMLRFHLLC
ncbi:hypothetical protein B0H16DRAFT_1324954 [Mycena metata]|uniref:LysM domain-containing protein n=1 Tax=Mycena metata TaxID=1033252 RepID=A0AAD7IBM6_9AGAR|nr:hypothetical protein B0H16DRAFT_1324954 [Mycena metata]